MTKFYCESMWLSIVELQGDAQAQMIGEIALATADKGQPLGKTEGKLGLHGERGRRAEKNIIDGQCITTWHSREGAISRARAPR